MRLSKLEMQGFKSFAKKTELCISDGVTAVIGPNGSGKSNLSDAIRWALGEQSARALRGNKMEDVIFNGTAVRRPLSMCSVSLTFDNSDRFLLCDANEVIITRRAYRSGESEYSINNKECRLKDVLNIFRDTGIGKDGYSIISQGGVDNILSNRTQDRREALEEAIGVTRYRVRREETIKKLAQAQKNIERLEDILHELNDRLHPLQIESEKAKESLSLQNDLKALELNHFIKETEKNEEKIKIWQSSLTLCEKESVDNQTEDLSLRNRIEQQEANLNKYESILSQTRDEEMRLMSQYDSFQSSLRIEKERMESYENESKRLAGEIDDLLLQIEQRNTIINSSDSDNKDLLNNLKDILTASENSYFSICESVENAEKELESMKTDVMDTLNQLSRSQSDRSRLEAMREALTARDDIISRDCLSYSSKEKELRLELEEAIIKYNEQKELVSKCIGEIQSIEIARKKVEDEKASMESALQTIEHELLSKQSGLRVLQELVKKREGYQNSVRLLMNDAGREESLSHLIIGVIAEMITVPKEYETAIGTALGASLQYIVASTGKDAKKIIEYVRQKQYGRVTVLPLDILRVYEKDSHVNTYLSTPGVIGVASELISSTSESAKAVEFLLGRTLVVQDINCALNLRREHRCYMQIVTLDGDVLQSGGILSGGSKIKKSYDLISREREISELEKLINALNEKRKKLNDSYSLSLNKWREYSSSLSNKQSELHDLQIKLELDKEKADIISRDIDNNEVSMQKLSEEKDGICESLSDIANKIDQLEFEVKNIEKSDSNAKALIIEMQKLLQGMRSEREIKLQNYTDAKVRFATAEKDVLAKAKEKQKLLLEVDSLSKRVEGFKSEIARKTELSDSALLKSEKLRFDSETVLLSIETQRNEIALQQEYIQEVKEDIVQCRHRRDDLLVENRSILEKQSKAEMSIGKLKTQNEQLADLIWQNYELTYENALAYRCETPISGMQEKINSIRKRIKEIGTINPGSIQEYADVSCRHEELSKQLSDINKASADLENLIDNLTKTMEETFKDGFIKIQGQFSSVFTELFGGGKAELQLKDVSDVLNCDIEIIAQPPGKKLQLLSLMSGGERALTAIALLFAMLRYKSPSFCVLDEIESSLDEENVARFASFLKQYGRQTQFIVITHRKGSMEAADSIYGVSMEERGISSIISTKWEVAV